MIEGVSGLLSVHHGRERPRYEPSKHQLVWSTGAIAQVFSAEDPDGLRGPQFDAAWCDEVAKWRHPDKTWDKLQFALRLGTVPQMVATTTPRAIPLLKRLLDEVATVVTRAATIDNTENLAPTFVAEMTRRYAGTALGRQELLGELVDDTSGSLWRRDWIDAHRVPNAPELTTIVVAVDPPVTATATSDACGIVVAGLGPDGRAYVIDDRTLQGRERCRRSNSPLFFTTARTFRHEQLLETDIKMVERIHDHMGCAHHWTLTVVPVLGPTLGIDITGDLVRQAGDQIVQTVQAIGGLAGTILTIYGRFRASLPLERRNLTLKF